MEARLIGLAGRAGSGKDYVGDAIRQRYHDAQRSARRIAFADGVRQEAENIIGGDLELVALWEKPYPDEIRALLQWWGTDLRRAQDPDYWVKYAFNEIAEWDKMRETVNSGYEFDLINPVDLWIFTDVRFANEAEAIQARGGKVYEVFADDRIRARRLGGTLPPEHASEDMDFDMDGIIMNRVDGEEPDIDSLF